MDVGSLVDRQKIDKPVFIYFFFFFLRVFFGREIKERENCRIPRLLPFRNHNIRLFFSLSFSFHFFPLEFPCGSDGLLSDDGDEE